MFGVFPDISLNLLNLNDGLWKTLRYKLYNKLEEIHAAKYVLALLKT